jgi:hypothetical protein
MDSTNQKMALAIDGFSTWKSFWGVISTTGGLNHGAIAHIRVGYRLMMRSTFLVSRI